MSDFLILRGPVPRRRIDGLARFLQLPGSSLSAAEFSFGSATLVALATGAAPRSTERWASDFWRCTGASVSRSGEGVAIETPFVTGRTLWRLVDDERDLWSTSLRALAFLVGDVQVDTRVASSMLVSGTLGPELSWDTRIQQASAASRFVLGTPGRSERVACLVDARSSRDWEAELDRRLRDVIGSLELDPTEWGLPLSGGVDSRGLAVALGGSLPSFTWGSSVSLADSLSDLSVAVRLAGVLGLDHRSMEIAAAASDPDLVLDRFVAASECRTENIGGYVDGMQLWQDLRAAGVAGIVRGDEAFGWNRRNDSAATRVSTGAILPGDVLVPSVLRPAFSVIGDVATVPWWLAQQSGECLPDYRDRLYRRFRCPSILAALTQTKSGYVDVTNPYLGDPIVELVMSMPARLRTDKRMFKHYVSARSLGVPFAQRSSVPPSSDFLGTAATSSVLCQRLATYPAPVGVDADILEFASASVPPTGSGAGAARGRRALAAAVRRTVPHAVRRERAIRQESKPQRLDETRLRFRTYLVAEGQRLMETAAAAGRAADPGRLTT